MRTIRVTFADGNSLVTGINGTEAEIRAYYLGQRFELDETKSAVEAISVEFIDLAIDTWHGRDNSRRHVRPASRLRLRQAGAFDRDRARPRAWAGRARRDRRCSRCGARRPGRAGDRGLTRRGNFRPYPYRGNFQRYPYRRNFCRGSTEEDRTMATPQNLTGVTLFRHARGWQVSIRREGEDGWEIESGVSDDRVADLLDLFAPRGHPDGAPTLAYPYRGNFCA